MHSVASVDGRLTTAPGVLLLYGDERWTAAAGDDSGVYVKLMATYQPQATLEGSGSLVPEGAQPEPLPPFEGDPAALLADFLPEVVVSVPAASGSLWWTGAAGRAPDEAVSLSRNGRTCTRWSWTAATPAAYLATCAGSRYVSGGGRGARRPGGRAGEMRVNWGGRTLVSTAGGKLNGR
jgi:hypothetical protein